MFGQEILSRNKDGWITVKYKGSCGFGSISYNKYILQLITGCGEYGKWFDMNYLFEILSFLLHKGLILWLTPIVGFVTKFYIQDKTRQSIYLRSYCFCLDIHCIKYTLREIRIGVRKNSNANNNVPVNLILYASSRHYVYESWTNYSNSPYMPRSM